MNLQMPTKSAQDYKSKSQKMRIMSESWAEQNLYCPCCGHSALQRFPNNRSVADLYCPQCQEQFELKSKARSVGRIVPDGAYQTMIQRIQSEQNPNFFFLNYWDERFAVRDLMIVPKHFFSPNVIQKRKPLNPAARRAGWVGCNILIANIPEAGKIYLVQNERSLPAREVVEKYRKTAFIAEYKSEIRGWLLDVLNCVEQIPAVCVSLQELYQFEEKLRLLHPYNRHIRAKIRQQLQILRDHSLIEFLGKGQYRKRL